MRYVNNPGTTHAYLACSTETYLKEDLTHIEKVFIEKNNFPK